MTMPDITISLDDLDQHVVTFGMDVYPAIEIYVERTRLNMFYEEAHEEWPDLFDVLTASDFEYRISKAFKKEPAKSGGPSLPVNIFELSKRGPVVQLPLVLPNPIGSTNLETTFLERFTKIRKLFFKHLPGRSLLRVGLVRDVVFATGEQRCDSFLVAAPKLAAAELQGGSCRFHYRDDKCNVVLQLDPVQAMTVTQLPVGATFSQHGGFGLHVKLDVNNAEIRPLSDEDIDIVIERAASLWPRILLDYIRGRVSG